MQDLKKIKPDKAPSMGMGVVHKVPHLAEELLATGGGNATPEMLPLIDCPCPGNGLMYIEVAISGHSGFKRPHVVGENWKWRLVYKRSWRG